MLEVLACFPLWYTRGFDVAEYEIFACDVDFDLHDRSFGEELMDELAGAVVKVPALLIMGEKDYVLKFPGIEELVNSEKAKELVPNLEITLIPEGTHFIHEQFPEQVNQLILKFLCNRWFWIVK